LIAVLSAFIAATVLLVLAGIESVQLAIHTFSVKLDPKAIKLLAVSFIEVIDILLLGTVFYITALGLYELFIDEKLPTPAWLHITHLDDLKSKLIGVVVVILVVTFLGQVVNWDGQRNLLVPGISHCVGYQATTIFLDGEEKNDKSYG
jgi:uncharacterized membrane protein YqhA